jgi:hypothetical protein
MRFLVLVSLLLAGCSSPIELYQHALDEYSAASAEGNLRLTLTGSALHSASQSQQFLKELGWTQLGQSKFEQTQLVGEGLVTSCLDVSGISFIDSSGVPVAIDRGSNRLLMEIEFSKTHPPLVSQMQEVGKC